MKEVYLNQKEVEVQNKDLMCWDVMYWESVYHKRRREQK
jgi:hypothetical protein